LKVLIELDKKKQQYELVDMAKLIKEMNELKLENKRLKLQLEQQLTDKLVPQEVNPKNQEIVKPQMKKQSNLANNSFTQNALKDDYYIYSLALAPNQCLSLTKSDVVSLYKDNFLKGSVSRAN
jgi:regulator of replication initiation timing